MCHTPAGAIPSINLDTTIIPKDMTTQPSPKLSDDATKLAALMNSKEKKNKSGGGGGIKILDPVHLALLEMKKKAI